jgi:hypothetical protein
MLSKSTTRYKNSLKNYLERKAKEGKTPENCDNVAQMVEYYNSQEAIALEREQSEEWSKNNLEYDLRTTEWILKKVRESNSYAQNLYAALCNNSFTKNEMWPLLKEETWSCSWRYAGGIIADMQQQGDYMNWYCSGIRDVSHDENVNSKWDTLKYVRESVVTEEIESDLFKLGWIVIKDIEE